MCFDMMCQDKTDSDRTSPAKTRCVESALDGPSRDAMCRDMPECDQIRQVRGETE